jgi:hypothetical protein
MMLHFGTVRVKCKVRKSRGKIAIEVENEGRNAISPIKKEPYNQNEPCTPS